MDVLKYFKDPIYGYIILPERLVKDIVDNPVFQRLKHIRQNGLANLVYPHLEHSRFSHSLGVGHLASEAIKSIVNNTQVIINQLKNSKSSSIATNELLDKINGLECLMKVIKCMKDYIVAIGLLHDIGHMPYSHVYEEALQEVDKIFKVNETKIFAIKHTSMDLVSKLLDLMHKLGGFKTIDLDILKVLLKSAFEAVPSIEEVKELYDKLRKSSDKRLIECLNTDTKCFENYDKKTIEYSMLMMLRLVRDLFNSNLDLDRADYLLRDSIEAGVRYGLYDVERLISVLVAVPLDPRSNIAKQPVLGIVDKGVSIVENMLISRAYMYSEVYLHRITATYNSLLARYIALLIKLGETCQCNNLRELNPKTILNTEREKILKLTDELIATLVNNMGIHVLKLKSDQQSRDDIDICIIQCEGKINIYECVALHLIPYMLLARIHPQVYYTTENEKVVYDNVEKNIDTINQIIRNNPLLMLWREHKSVYTRRERGRKLEYYTSLRVLQRRRHDIVDVNIEDRGILKDVYNTAYYKVSVISPIKLDVDGISLGKRVLVKGKFDVNTEEYREITLAVFKHCLSMLGNDHIHKQEVDKKFEEFTIRLESDTERLLKIVFR